MARHVATEPTAAEGHYNHTLRPFTASKGLETIVSKSPSKIISGDYLNLALYEVSASLGHIDGAPYGRFDVELTLQ